MHLLLLVALISQCNALSSPHASTYHAGVVEYEKYYSVDPIEERNKNLANYLELIYSRDADHLDILVFPEATLNNFETVEFLPDEPNGQIATEIAFAARSRKMYIVVNFYETSVCPDDQQKRFNDTRPCPSDGLNIYNTNAVFDTNGNLVAKYRKYNLYGEAGVTHPLYPESIPFTTSFGVTFGNLICFDLLFERPAMDLMNDGITDFIVTKMWYSKAPFLTAVQIQQSWAYGNDINLLAAGASNPSRGSTGTGIYHGKFGALTAVMNYQSERKIYQAIVPKQMSRVPIRNSIKGYDSNDMLSLFLKSDNSTPFITEQIPQINGTVQRTLCMRSCCQFEIDYRFMKSSSVTYTYRMMAYSGLRTIKENGTSLSAPEVPKREAVEICAIVACSDDTVESCSKRIENVEAGFIFDSVKISTQLPREERILVMPTSASLSIMPYPVSDFKLTETVDRNVTIELLTSKDDVYSFGIYARNFDQDAQPTI